MSDQIEEKEAHKEALKKIKAARQAQIAAATSLMKEQRRVVKAIKEQLADAELTVPEIAAATGLAASEVLWQVATMKKYGEILEGPKDGSYFRYRLGQPAEAEPDPSVTE
jgi:predicted Rossmann fold nucleotide-binding protein DprA/Smf involved in DNA uptake